MFTGIIQGLGEILSISKLNKKNFTINTELDLNNCKIGSSISCDGICLTTIKINKINNFYQFDVNIGEETFIRTSVKSWKQGTKLNLEKSLKFGDELSGHLVYGHIDCVAKLYKIKKLDSSWNLFFNIDNHVFKKNKKYLVKKGSISINGISLTIANINDNLFDVSIIPHTYNVTNLSYLNEGDFVNIEFDTLAKYLLS
tara:strand:- start:1705 stop:2301 length:597 start_codon:yes stop_codon:yes gene_type:complete